MTPSLPLAVLLGHTADAVHAVLAQGRSLSDALERVPAPARAGTQALAFDVMRRLGAAQAARALLAPKPPPAPLDALLVSALALLWPAGALPYPEHTLVDQAVAAARRRNPAASGFVNAVLRRFARERAALVAAATRDPRAAFNHPPWWIERVRADWPAQWRALLDANQQRPPMTLRVNARRGDAASAIARLAAHGIGAYAIDVPAVGTLAVGAPAVGAPALGTPALAAAPAIGPRAIDPPAPAAAPALPPALDSPALATHAIGLDTPLPVSALPGFADGELSVQDAAAQLAAPLLLGPGLRRGARVLDACAAPGGKTAHLLELADLDLLALDIDPQRLERVQQTLGRLHLAAELKAADATQPAAWWDGRAFDAILLDAPCSGSGVVRRHPDIRWLRRAGDIVALAARQSALLDALWSLLAPGGRLLYCSCSIFRAEGQQVIDAFLQRETGARARLDPASPGHLLPLADNAAGPKEPGAAADGFFYALLHKT